MPTLDARPQSVDVAGYAGDTLALQVTVEGDWTGYAWTADLRQDVDDAAAVTQWTITPQTVADGPAYMVLDSDTTRMLAGLGTVVKVTRNGVTRAVQRFSGVWDLQVADALVPPRVRTLCQGTLTIDIDITRPAAGGISNE